MRHENLTPGRYDDPFEVPLGGAGGSAPAPDTPHYDRSADLPAAWRASPMRWMVRLLAVIPVVLVLAIAWLAITAPLSKSLEPPAPPSITLLSAEGTPIARRGAIIGDPVDAAALPEHVTGAFLAIEDRRFQSHWGIDPRGIARAFVNNTFTDNSSQGGSTITQQLAKNAFLSSDRTFGRKAQEAMIALWLEAWLTKDEILSRYLSNVYFGDNVYGLSAAANHYFSRKAEDLTIGQAAMLAGLVKAPSRLAPSSNLEGARERQELVVAAMADTGVITAAEAEDVSPARLKLNKVKALPSGTYFADWVLPAARDEAGGISNDQTVRTTLQMDLQKAAERAVRNAGLREAQVGIVAMRPDGRVVAMVGGKDYKKSPFNRATQAQRQPGSTFKLFVYLAALRAGYTPDSMVDDSPVTIGEWSPKNNDNRYRGEITLEEAFARSSNVVAARLTADVGPKAVIRAARDLGISTPIPNEASIALGTSSVSLLELTAAYAAIAAGETPVRPRGLEQGDNPGWFERLSGQAGPIDGDDLANLRQLLNASITRGTGTRANLAVEAFGKTGTTQDNRDALFVGYSGDLVVGVWVGNDDNTPNPGLSGGGVPARIWRDFMTRALGVSGPAREAPPVAEVSDEDALDALIDNSVEGLEVPPIEFEGEFGGRGLAVRVAPDGTLEVIDRDPRREEPPLEEVPPDPELIEEF
ncbi:transglycosylase domain-containing protein [Sphingomonas japonica]|uniref:peptidoglycan glycosyltransferase n=1 Tax=Sphingomonas japonica TaxID=511662 RepID=A0ABX0U348_9SPHN|nr:PBP1A family penicillin-binding protein [Sphingomonas japonica]NIJ23801.1 penicillin-binding protein 1A [Sphingomonas japonica]